MTESDMKRRLSELETWKSRMDRSYMDTQVKLGIIESNQSNMLHKLDDMVGKLHKYANRVIENDKNFAIDMNHMESRLKQFERETRARWGIFIACFVLVIEFVKPFIVRMF